MNKPSPLWHHDLTTVILVFCFSLCCCHIYSVSCKTIAIILKLQLGYKSMCWCSNHKQFGQLKSQSPYSTGGCRTKSWHPPLKNSSLRDWGRPQHTVCFLRGILKPEANIGGKKSYCLPNCTSVDFFFL